MHKVIFDTNSIKNESTENFLGGRSELEKFSNVAEVIIPDIVIEEIKNHKRKHLISKRDSFLSNPFHFLRNLNVQETKELDIEKVIVGLEEKENFSYTIITLTNPDALEKIKMLSLKNSAPFEKDSDKGFKDAYLYLTVLEYIESYPEDKIFLVTRDNRLKQSFEGIGGIQAIDSFDEFERYIDDYFKSNYFVDRLKEVVDDKIKNSDIQDAWINSEENWILKIKCKEKTYFIEVDFSSREIISHTDFNFLIFIEELISSRSFSTTHSMVASLGEYIKYFLNTEIVRLIEAATDNSQIYLIRKDRNIREFFIKLYTDNSKLIVDEDVEYKFKRIFN